MTTITADVRPDAADEPTAAPDPRWARPGLLALLAGTAVLYLWGLGSSGWANSYYAAAAQAGTQSWKAWLFGSLDAGNAITVDKPPAAMWAMGLSGRLFGFNEFTMLLPQALMGVAAVAVLYFTVKRSSGPGAGLIAGAVLALTPVATLMFRYNNPDALLVLLLVVAAYCTVRAIENGSARWMALTGCVVGFAFLTKMLQAVLIVPGLALAFLVAAPIALSKRLGALLVGGATMVVSAGWYVALVSLWPADSRPYIAGSTDNSLMQLALGYNGIQRIAGGEHGGAPGGGGHGPGGPGGNLFFGGEPGIGRMFGPSFGTEASWLLPAAIIGLLAGLWLTWRTARTGRVWAGLLLWGGWLLVTGAVFSFMDGTVHPYYTVALAPAIAALVGISVAELLRRKDTWQARSTLAVMLAVTGVWAFVLLNRTPDWMPALRWIVLVGAIVVAAAVALRLHRPGRTTVVVLVAAALFGLGASAAYSIETMSSTHTGPMSTSGPAKANDFFGGGHGPGGRGGDDAALESLVRGTDNRWAAAAVGSFQVSDLELKTGASLMAIGGFTGGDPSPTLAQFQQYVADGQVRYFIAGNDKEGGPMSHRTGVASDIQTWVEQHFTKMDVGGTTVYDLQPHA
jgi:4-amino-4-deoxy-L-arabinose transferase-like glycosyltransferase